MKSLNDIFKQAHRLSKLAGSGMRVYRISVIMHAYRNNIVEHICPGQNPLWLPDTEVNRKFPREIYAK